MPIAQASSHHGQASKGRRPSCTREAPPPARDGTPAPARVPGAPVEKSSSRITASSAAYVPVRGAVVRPRQGLGDNAVLESKQPYLTNARRRVRLREHALLQHANHGHGYKRGRVPWRTAWVREPKLEVDYGSTTAVTDRLLGKTTDRNNQTARVAVPVASERHESRLAWRHPHLCPLR